MEKVKYKTLEEPCLSCIYKCFRVEDPNFTADKNCKYAEKPREKFEEILGIQEEIWKTK